METSLAAKMEPPPLLSHGRGEARSEAKVWETHHQGPPGPFVRRCFWRAPIEEGVETDLWAPRKGWGWRSSEGEGEGSCWGFCGRDRLGEPDG